MKKKLLMMLALSLVLGLCACGNGASTSNQSNSNNTNEESSEEPKTVTVEVNIDNWQDYYELKDIVVIRRDEFDDVEYVDLRKCLVLKDEFKERAVDGEISVETYATNDPNQSYIYQSVIYEYNIETMELKLIETVQTYEDKTAPMTTTSGDYNSYAELSLRQSSGHEVEGEDIIRFKTNISPNFSILRIKGTLTLLEE